MLKRVKKIVSLTNQLKHDNNLSDKQKIKIEKKIEKLKKKFFHVMDHEFEDRVIEVYFGGFGKQVIVDYELKKVMVIKGEIPKSFKTHLFSFLLAYSILMVIFIISVFLGAFGIISENLTITISLVMNASAIVLNVWNMIDGKLLFKQFKIFYFILPFAICLNGFSFVIDIMRLME